VALIGRGGYPVLDGKVGASQIEAMLVDFVAEKMREKMERGADLEIRVSARIEVPPEKDDPETIVRPVEGFESGIDSAGGGIDKGTERERVVSGDGEEPPPELPPEELPEVTGKTVDYRVQKGDTLASISIVFYGTADYWRHIVAANPGLNGADLPVGEVIQVPLKPTGEG